MMSMAFHWSTAVPAIIFDWWAARTPTQYFGLLVVTFVLSFVYEAQQALSAALQAARHTAEKYADGPRSSAPLLGAEGGVEDERGGECCEKVAPLGLEDKSGPPAVSVLRKLSALQLRLLWALNSALLTAVSLLLMFVAMSFNSGLFVSLLLGNFAGRLVLFASMPDVESQHALCH
eukprot:PLAT14571.1.p1 GENE.PLAT14571.1~~PLAT14571.1.p1  ORF type:complete len:176 (+),score=43.13 PLAT14571.1:87-614(+)